MGEALAGLVGMVEVRVLGPVELRRGGQALPLSAGRRPQLLLALALRANQVVSLETLIDDVWGADAPAQAAKTLRAHVSALRSIIEGGGGGAALRSQRPGYVLEIDEDRIDATLFRRLAAQGRCQLETGDAAGAAATLERALDLWRGEPGQGCSIGSDLAGVVAALDDARVAATEDRLAADLALGRSGVVVGALEPLLALHPLRERLRELHMLALYRAGRQAEALRSYQAARQALVAEAGLEPSARLRQLEAAILRQDPALDVESQTVGSGPQAEAQGPAAGAPRGVPSAGAPPLVGRDRQLRDAGGVIRSGATGKGQVLLVTGEPGAGKSTLLERLAHEAASGGSVVLRGRCDHNRGAPAFWPWIQVLRDHTRRCSDQSLQHDLGTGASDLVTLVPELATRVPVGSPPAGPGSDPDAARFRFFDAVAGMLQRASERHPMVVVLDDLQWADTSSLRLLEFLARRVSGSAVVVIAAWRTGEGDRDALAELSALPESQVMALPSLDADAVGELVHQLTGDPLPPELAHRVATRTGGNPLFVRELTRAAPTPAALEMAVADGARLPGDVGTLVMARVGSLSPAGREILDVAAVAGRQVMLAVLQLVAELPRATLLSGLDEALEHGLLQPVAGSLTSYRFAHDLMRQAVYEGLALHRRRDLHHRLATVMETLDPAGTRLEEIAHHYAMAAAAGADVSERAVSLVVQAAERAASAHAHEEAASHYTLAVEIAQGHADQRQRAELLLGAGWAHWRARRATEARASFDEAAAVARAQGHQELVARAVLGMGAGGPTNGTVDDDLVRALRHASDRLPRESHGLRARVLARLAMELYFAGEPSATVQLVDAAVDEARRAADPAALADATWSMHFCLRRPETLGERLEVADRLVQLAVASGRPEHLLKARHARFSDLLEAGDVDAASRELEAYESLASEVDDPQHRAQSVAWRALLAQLSGDLPTAETLAREAYELAQPFSADTALQMYGVQLATIRWEQGRAGELVDTVRRLVDSFPAAPAWRCAVALLCAASGRDDEARTELRSLAAGDFAGLPRDVNWLAGIAVLAPVCASLGEREVAGRLHSLLLPHAGQHVVVGGVTASACYGSVEHFLGLLADTAGSLERAISHHRAGVAANRRIGAESWVARGEAELARLLLRRADAGDPAARREAVALMDSAARARRRLGLAEPELRPSGAPAPGR